MEFLPVGYGGTEASVEKALSGRGVATARSSGEEVDVLTAAVGSVVATMNSPVAVDEVPASAMACSVLIADTTVDEDELTNPPWEAMMLPMPDVVAGKLDVAPVRLMEEELLPVG